MKIVDLPLKNGIPQKIAHIESFSTLNPPQVESIKAGLLKKQNLLISIPTASGKTFIAEICAIQHILEFKKQVIYLSPLIALASEKYHDFKRFKSLGIKTGITVGDFDSPDRIDSYDFLVSTNEKIDSLLRHRRKFITENVSLVIIDECHLIDDSTRGPTLESLIVKIRILNPSIQILALSATVSNSIELAKWLDAKLVESDWRSVPLKEYYVKTNGDIFGRDKSINSLTLVDDSVIKGIVRESLIENTQVLTFANSRKRAETISTDLIDLCSKFQRPEDKDKIKKELEIFKRSKKLKDKTSIALIKTIENGVAFHHAGLNSNQRSLIERLFKKKLIKVIAATPTLAAGINLPAKKVILANIWRYSSYSGRILPLKIMEYEQMRGRAGRPKYDKFGECYVISQNERDEEIILEKYFSDLGAEKIESKLALRPTLRIQILGTIASGIIRSYDDARMFLEKSFFGFQYDDFSRLENILSQVLNDLESFNFILIENESIIITRLGRRVSQLYIDPVTANILIKGIIKALNFDEYYPLSFIHLYCLVPDISRVRLKRNDWGKIDLLYEENKDKLISDESVVWNYNLQSDIEAFKSAIILEQWIKEIPLTKILEDYDLTPGDFQRLHDLVSWISYSSKELIKEVIFILENYEDQFQMYFEDLKIVSKTELVSILDYISGIEIRLKEGIKDDILDIVKIKGLGRVKARSLANHGIRNLESLKQTPSDELLIIRGFGPNLIESIMKQIGGKTIFSKQSLKDYYQTKSNVIKQKKKKTIIDFLE